MAAGKKNAKVKWAIGGSEPDDLPDFETNDDIVKRNKGKLPPKGRTRVLIKKLTVKPNRNGDDRINVTCEIAEGKGKKREPFDGYTMWEGFNVTEQGAPYLKRFLTAIGVTWGDFMKNTVIDETVDPKVINKIGSVKFDKPVEAFVSIKHGVDQQDEERAEVGRFLPPPDEDEDEDEPEDETDEDVEDDVELDDDSEEEAEDEEDSDADEEDEEDEEDEDAEEELREELKALKLVGLKKRAIRSGADEDDLPAKKAELIDLIVELELDEEEEDEEDEDEDEEAEDEVTEEDLRAELKSLALGELRDRARSNGRKHSDLKGAKKSGLIDMIVEDEIPPF